MSGGSQIIYADRVIYIYIYTTDNQLKQIINRDLWQRKMAARNRKPGRPIAERKGKVIPCRGAKDRKGAGTNGSKPGLRNMEAECVRSNADSMEQVT